MAFQLEILSPQKVVYRGSADEVIAPAINGEIDLLPQHAKYTTLLKEGPVTFKTGGQSQMVTVSGGLAVVENDVVTLLVQISSDQLA